MNIKIPLWLILLLAVIFTSILGLFLPGRLMLPLLQFIPAYLVLVYFSRRGRLARGIFWLLLWVLMFNVVMVCLVVLFPVQCGKMYKAAAYWREMEQWIRAGGGLEGTWQKFLPYHLLQLVKFSLAAFLSGGVVALFVGVIQLDYMNYYVGMLVSGSSHPFKAFFFGWHIWSVCRVAGYIIICSVLAQPLLARLFRYRLQLRLWIYLAVGLGLVFIDLVLKYALNSELRGMIAGVMK